MGQEIPLIPGGSSAGKVVVSDEVFGQEYNEPLIHQVVTAYLAGQRAGTRAQKSRSQVSGGGSKPWRQKGTGRARVGSIRSPLWRSGGVTFAASKQSYGQKVNKKMYRGGMRSILSELLRQGRLFLGGDLKLEVAKTKALADKVKAFGFENVLLVTHEEDLNLTLASRNLPNVDVCAVARLNPVNLVAAEAVVVSSEAAKSIEERFG